MMATNTRIVWCAHSSSDSFPNIYLATLRAAFIVWNGPKSSCHYQTTARDFKSTYKLNLIKHLRSFLLWIFGSFSMKCERVIFSSFFFHLYSLSNQCEYLNLAIWLQNYMFSSNEHRIMRSSKQKHCTAIRWEAN